jgi:hypothetical protein
MYILKHNPMALFIALLNSPFCDLVLTLAEGDVKEGLS